MEQHEQLDDVRTQLKFFEQLDQMEKQRKEEQEREILLKAAKVTDPRRRRRKEPAEKKPCNLPSQTHQLK